MFLPPSKTQATSPVPSSSDGKSFLTRYEDEINKRTEKENEFVLIKKVRGPRPPDPGGWA